jgi:predicted ArsR family transcriptional regulator
MSTLRHRVWCVVKRGPTSAVEVAELLGLEYEHARTLFRDLRCSGYITLDHRIGRESFYRITDTPCPRDGRDGRPGPRRSIPATGELEDSVVSQTKKNQSKLVI